MDPLPQLVLKVDVDTYVGMRDGVPALQRALDARGLLASVYVSCGPDHSGRALRRVFKPGFLAKMLRTNAPGMYGWRTTFLIFAAINLFVCLPLHWFGLARRDDTEGGSAAAGSKPAGRRSSRAAS